jgi:hypothetical protein
MAPLDHWRLCDELSVIQAALLIVGADPSGCESSSNGPEVGYDAAKTALMNAIIGKRLRAKVAYDYVEGEDGEWTRSKPDWHQTTIVVEDLRAWLKSRGVSTGFFFPEPQAVPDFLSKSHENFSSKLAAAIQAWKAVTADPELRNGKSVKQALMVWLRQHASEYGLTKEDGSPNEQGIDDVAKVANWDTKGGAPRTPGNE